MTGSVPDGAVIRYRHGADIIAEQPFSDAVDGNKWSWQPPKDDYQGYLVDLYTKKDGKETILATCAVDVSSSWTRYPRYDFLTAYEQLLRGTSSNCSFTPAVSGSQSMTVWPPKANTVTVFAKNVGNATVVHFLNFLNTDDLSWRDADGTRMEPQMVDNTTVTIKTVKKLSRLWVASPDTLGGAPVDVPFTQNGDEVTFVLPSLKYWTMAVMEGEESRL